MPMKPKVILACCERRVVTTGYSAKNKHLKLCRSVVVTVSTVNQKQVPLMNTDQACLCPAPGFSQSSSRSRNTSHNTIRAVWFSHLCARWQKNEKNLRELPSFQGLLQTGVSAILTVKKVISAVLPPSQGHTWHTAGLGPALSVLDLGQNGQHVYQSPAQPRTRENDAANNIITALVHISLIWQKPSLSSVSHMVHCSSVKGRSSTNGRI